MAIDDMENAVADNMQVSYAAWNWWILHGSQEDISPQMSAVRVPVLIISGAKDPKFSSIFLKREMIKYFPLAVEKAMEKFIEEKQ